MSDPNMTIFLDIRGSREGVRRQGAGDVAINGVSIDTRSLQPGDLFVAPKDARDGQDFVANAFAAGAEAALVSRDVLGAHPGLMVGDVLEGAGKTRACGAGAEFAASSRR